MDEDLHSLPGNEDDVRKSCSSHAKGRVPDLDWGGGGMQEVPLSRELGFFSIIDLSFIVDRSVISGCWFQQPTWDIVKPKLGVLHGRHHACTIMGHWVGIPNTHLTRKSIKLLPTSMISKQRPPIDDLRPARSSIIDFKPWQSTSSITWSLSVFDDRQLITGFPGTIVREPANLETRR
jgi:hypothetical protein